MDELRTDYGVILADPPWTFATFSAKGEGKSPSQHYSTMTLDNIAKLPIAKLAADDCALFLWATWPTIFDAQRIIEAWGFKYSGLAWEWIKYNPQTKKFAFGCGYGTRKNLEPCLLARRGKPKLLAKNVRDFIFDDGVANVIASPRREHSRKPDGQFERIECMYAGPYLELFARSKRQGWDAWGNEVGKYGPPVGL